MIDNKLKTLLAVVQYGGYSRAAAALNLTQPAVSYHIKQLEEELGIRIFHRSNRGIALTVDGRELLAQVAPLVERSRKIQNYYSERRV